MIRGDYDRLRFGIGHIKFSLWVYGCMGVWVYGCMGVWVYGCMGVWVYGCMGVWVYGRMGIWVYGCMVKLRRCEGSYIFRMVCTGLVSYAMCLFLVHYVCIRIVLYSYSIVFGIK